MLSYPLLIATESIFWFCIAGAGAASLRHLLKPVETLQELTPVALHDVKGKPTPSPEALFWGSYAFSAMNAGFCTIGIFGGVRNSIETKAAYMLGTGVLFECFALVWLRHGAITGKKDPLKQCAKIAAMGVLFLGGFAMQMMV